MFNKKRIIIFIGFILLMFFMTTFAGGPTQNDTVATRLVTFIDGITENEISKQEIEVGGEALVPDAPKHTNYVFVGWFDGELEVKNFKNILSNLTVTAKYAGDINNNGIADELEERYTVTFVDGFNNLVISRVDVLSGMDAEAPVVPTHTGYTFVGWNGDYTNVTTTRTITANYRLTSVRVETFTVTFVDGVSNEILSTQTIESGLSASAPVPKSYAKKVFVGWDKSYTNVTGDLTITSKYADDLNENGVDDNLDNKYSVVFNVTGNGVLNGTLNYSDILEGLTLEEALIVIPTPTADAGYTFMGWLVTPEKDTKVNGNLVFTAVFEDITKPTFHPEYWRKTVEADKTATFTCPSATGSDTAGGNVVVTLLNNTVEMGVPGDYKCQYVTEDANGNKAYNDVFIKVVDTTKPTFHPEYWRKTVEADKTATFTCPSATGSDNAEGNVVVTLRNNTVNMGVPGDYKCQYVTEDANGNKAYNDVFIKVVDTTKPTFHPEYWRKTVEVDRNATFTCPSATGSDNAEGNVTVTLHNNTVDMSNPGDYKCQYVTEDANGNKAYNDVFIKVVDTTRPTFELLLPTEGQCLNANDVPTKAIASDNHLLEIITINLYSENNILIRGSSTRGINDITGSHEYNFKDLNLPDGKYVIKANAKDVTGNTSATTTREFCIDSTAPVLKININKTTNKTYLNDGDHVNQSQTPELEVVDTNLDKMIVMNENREVKKVFEGPYKYTTSYNKINWLSDGTYIIYAIDKAGNISNEMTITLDSVAPSATVAYNPDVVNNGSVTATVTFSEPLKQKPVLKAKEYDGGAVKSWMKCNTELTVCTLQHWYNRNYVIEFYDLADNLGEVTISFNTIDKSAPIIDEITHTPTTTAKEVTVTVTAHDKGDTTNGKKDGLVAGLHTEAYSFDGGVTWQADNTFVVSDNTTLKIVVRDALGNKTKVNDYAITNIKKDTTAPVITVLGDNPAYVLENDNYVDSGATALDETDGDLTNLIVTNGTVDTSTLGTYTLTYVVSDKSLNEATATRTVKVLDPDGDEDNDGFTNEEELEEGTDPEDDTDFPSLNGLN